jgi:hypothetical protein
MRNTIFDLVPENVKKEWDGEDYKILGPENLEDEPVVSVVLINQNETEIIVNLPLQKP